MKQTIFYLMIVTIAGCTTPNLKIELQKSNGIVYLLNTTNQKVDTIKYDHNTITFTEETDQPILHYLYFEEIKNSDRPIRLILSNETTIIKFDSIIVPNESLSISSLYPNRPKFLKDPNQNEAFYNFQDMWISFYDSIMAISDDEEIITKRMDRINLKNEFVSKSKEIILENNHKLVSAVILEYLITDKLLSLNEIQEYYSLLDTVVQKSNIGQKISKKSSLDINSKAPYFEFENMNGDVYNLDKFKDKIVLLHFWSTTCAPCIKEIPTMLKLKEAMSDLIIINVSLDYDSIRWVNGITKFGINGMINTCDFKGFDGKIAKDYYIDVMPAYYLINRQGEIVSKKDNIADILNYLK